MPAVCHVEKFSPVYSNSVLLFLHPSGELYERILDFQWFTKLPYLADIFSTLSSLNVAMQGKTATIFNVQDKIKATRLQMESRRVLFERREPDFLLSAGEDVDGSTVAPLKQHLQDLHSLGIYCPELDASFELIRNPFGDKHAHQASRFQAVIKRGCQPCGHCI